MGAEEQYVADLKNLKDEVTGTTWRFIHNASRSCEMTATPDISGRKNVKDNVQNLGNFFPWHWEDWMKFHSNLVYNAAYKRGHSDATLAGLEHSLAVFELVGAMSNLWIPEIAKICPQETIDQFNREAKKTDEAATRTRTLIKDFYATHREIIAQERATDSHRDHRRAIASAARMFIRTAQGKTRDQSYQLNPRHRGSEEDWRTWIEEEIDDFIDDIRNRRWPFPGKFWNMYKRKPHPPLCANT